MIHKDSSPQNMVTKYYLYHRKMSNDACSRKVLARLQHESGKQLAMQALEAITHKASQSLTITHTPQGVPFCPQIPCALSISHSAREVVALIGPWKSAIGIDVQKVEPQRPYADLAARFVDADRKRWILEGDVPMRFCYVWTRMEAMMKATGEAVIKLLATPEDKDLPLSSHVYQTDEGLFVLSIYGTSLTPSFARPLSF